MLGDSERQTLAQLIDSEIALRSNLLEYLQLYYEDMPNKLSRNALYIQLAMLYAQYGPAPIGELRKLYDRIKHYHAARYAIRSAIDYANYRADTKL